MADRPPSIAATSTLAMVRAAESRGIRTADILERAGLTRAFLEDAESRIPAPTVLSVWSALRERTGDPALQLVAPTSLSFGEYRVMDYLVNASRTVGEGVSRFVQYFTLITAAAALSIEEEGDERRLLLTAAGGGHLPPMYADYVFAALVTRIRIPGRGRPSLRLSRIELHQPQPLDPAPHERVFPGPVRFGAPADRLCFSKEEWDAPMEGADEALAHLLEEHARMLATRSPQVAGTFRAEVLKALAEALPGGGSAQEIARALHVSVRTLQRKLVEEGTTFRALSDAARGKLAQEYLADPKVSSAEVAMLLGFSDPSSFTRAFRRWTGASPARWRRRLR